MRSPQAELPLWDEPPTPPGRGDGELRRLVLGDRIVPYVLRRGRRRTIGLTIDQRGLRVGAPARSTLAEIEAVIRKHAAWVADKLDSWRQHAAARATPLADGLAIPLLGGSATLRLATGGNRFAWCDGPVLELRPREPALAAPLLERALRARALEHFHARMSDFCARFAIAPPRLRLTSARTRWGSCSRAGGVRLNWRLIHAAPELVDYVVAHELAHLREMNHTARFWAEVERMFPDWRGARAALQRFSEQLPSYASPRGEASGPADDAAARV